MTQKSQNLRGRLENGKPNPVDVYVGARIKARRRMLNLSQEELSQKLGLTFQQIQKYERAVNRVGASRLWDISRVLDVSMDFFFADMPPDIQTLSPAFIKNGTNLPTPIAPSNDPLKAQETLELVRDYYKFKSRSPKGAKQLKDLIHQLSLAPCVSQEQ